MSSRRRARAAATVAAMSTGGPVTAGYERTADAVVCVLCGRELPVYAGRELRRVHDAWHAVKGGRTPLTPPEPGHRR